MARVASLAAIQEITKPLFPKLVTTAEADTVVDSEDTSEARALYGPSGKERPKQVASIRPIP